ncbi:MAG: Asp-tRNA(Asn)/Glu-tRNA(Gln) amidotransferase subunit GatC [Alphaproteobacteria bacterium]
MSIDKNTVRKVASLARLEMDEAGIEKMTPKLNGILQWIEQLQAVNTDGIEPLANVANIELKLRPDAVTDGGCADKVLANAPEEVGGFFVVPKVLE